MSTDRVDNAVIGRFLDISLESILDARAEHHPEKVERLFHYTGAAALISIIQTGELWATAIDKLNDKTEGTYGAGKFHEALVRMEQSSIPANSGVLRSSHKNLHLHKVTAERQTKLMVLRSMRNYIDFRRGETDLQVDENKHITYMDKSFALCFSELGDDLAQWRGYGSNGQGYAIEFSADGIHESIKKYKHKQTLLTKIIYDPEVQLEIAKKCITNFMNLVLTELNNNPLPNNKMLNTVIHYAMEHILDLTVSFMKNPSFSSEREWRLLDFGRNEKRQFREGKGLVVPYVPVNLQIDNRLPIHGVLVGPCLDFNKATTGLTSLFAEQDEYRKDKQPVILESRIPYLP